MTPRSAAADPLAILEVIDRLEVGPVSLRKNRLSVPYRVVRGKHIAEKHLVYRFEEAVFDPEDPTSQNLAAMIAAQVALNYGLFCKSIVLRGPYDGHDRRLLRRMLANTAREIFVKKFLEPNPFLVDSVRELPAVRRKNYARAELIFVGKAPRGLRTGWASRANGYAVLSSGGKDSLLSFGLLRELGKEPHPVFVNEAGRHWYTALNAYRAFRRSVPQTARVWTNSDRMFAWMLRQLPFVRRDFHAVRADMYPIRLWTVAVFLFGALPILRKRRLGMLVVGDEHDSTVRARHRGISHYDGLFDQSAYFDTALTSYFFAKGWRVAQLSLLRPMSEMLIEKTLAERYPDLLRLQVSCHAAHLDKDTVRPCGKCEKCRRIVGMLLGLGQDPGACGYDEEQIAAMKVQLLEQGVHQERPATEHLAMLLHEKGILPEPRLGEVAARARPEALQLRFHPRRAAWSLCPRDLRAPLLRMLSEHAEGAVDVAPRGGGKQVDVAADPRLSAEGAIDQLWASPPVASGAGGADRSHVWGELTWPRARRRQKLVDIALLPVGAVEQHGPHLPLDTDAFDAEYLTRAVADRCTDPKPFVLPLVPYGVSYHHDDFAGTLSVGNEALTSFVYDLGMSLARNGIKKLIIINGHGGNGPALHFAAQMVNRDAHIFTCVETGETSDSDIESMVDTHNDAHAGEIETSTTLALRPELVDMSAAKSFVPRFRTKYLDYSHQRSVGWYARTANISRSGVLGDPTRATREKGERIWEIMIARLAEFVEHVKVTPLDELYQPRY